MIGKEKCNFLKGIRKRMAEANGIPYEPRECTYEGDCTGTCPFCEKEAADLMAELKKREAEGVEIEKGVFCIEDEEKWIQPYEDQTKRIEDRNRQTGWQALVNEYTPPGGIVSSSAIDPFNGPNNPLMAGKELNEMQRFIHEQEKPLLGDVRFPYKTLSEKEQMAHRLLEEEMLRQKEETGIIRYDGRIVVDYNNLIENPMKVLIEDIMGMERIKEGYLSVSKKSPDLKSPVHVSSFYITRTPLTIELWKILMNDNDRLSYSRRVEWADYLLLLNKLKEITKVDFSLPSSIQWEYATRTSDYVEKPSYTDNQRYYSYIAVGLWNLYKKEWCPYKDEDLPYQVLCSMGNGHEELFLFLATKGDFPAFKYSEEEKERLCALVREIPYIKVINMPRDV